MSRSTRAPVRPEPSPPISTAMIVPAEFKKYTNPYSGYLQNCQWANKSIKGLFFSPPNKHYLAAVLQGLVTNRAFVVECLLNGELVSHSYNDVAAANATNRGPIAGGQRGAVYYDEDVPHDRYLLTKRADALIRGLAVNKPKIAGNIDVLQETWVMPYREELFAPNGSNPLNTLHHLNEQFLREQGRAIVQNPTSIMADFYSHNAETGQDESSLEYDYTSASYADGVWHPEHLFTNSDRNKENPYWVPIEVNFIGGSEEEGLGHRYYTGAKAGFSREAEYRDPRTGKILPAPNKYAHSQRTRSQFPRWQAVNAFRQIDYENSESLWDGGSSDRRVQRPHGYNMANLTHQSTY